MKETIEQTIKRLRFCQGCINIYTPTGTLDYEFLEKQISELEAKLENQKNEKLNKAAE